MQDYRRLKVWQAAHRLTLEVYRSTGGFPADERFGMVSQMRRAAVSIPTNIAEGCGRGSDADFCRFVSIALGSACELEYLGQLASELGYLDTEMAQRIHDGAVETKRMLSSLVRKLRMPVQQLRADS